MRKGLCQPQLRISLGLPRQLKGQCLVRATWRSIDRSIPDSKPVDHDTSLAFPLRFDEGPIVLLYLQVLSWFFNGGNMLRER